MRHRILVINSDTNEQKQIQAELLKAMFYVDIASTVSKGIQKSQAEDFDLILLDLEADGLFGLEIKKHLFQPFIMLTTKSSPDNDDVAKRLGSQGVIAKPLHILSALSLIQRGIEKGGKEYRAYIESLSMKRMKDKDKSNVDQSRSESNLIAIGCLMAGKKMSKREACLHLQEKSNELGINIELVSSQIIENALTETQ